MPDHAKPRENEVRNCRMSKYVLCRPRGGLNDMLCQIEHCLRYCRKYGRTLILDTSKSGMRDHFQKYFAIVDNRGTQVISLDEMPVDINGLSTVPRGLQGRALSYVGEDVPGGEVRDIQTGEIVNFDLRSSHSADLLIQERAGGGINSYWILQHLQPTKLVIRALKEKQKSLPDNYVALHIRNTDLQTDYTSFVNSISWAIKGRNVLVGTDSAEIQTRLPEMNTGAKGFHFPTKLNPHNTERLHDSASTDETSNLEMLTDLFTLAFGRRLYFTFTEQGYVSGFSGLAFALSHSKLARNVALELGRSSSPTMPHFRVLGFVSYLRNQAVLIAAKSAISVAVRTREFLQK